MRKLFEPLLKTLDAGDEPYVYKKSSRTILLVVGGLFSLLFCLVVAAGIYFKMAGAIIPGVVFFVVGGGCIVVSLFGSDRAVAKLWGNR